MTNSSAADEGSRREAGQLPGTAGPDDAAHGKTPDRTQVPRWVWVFTVIGLLIAIFVVILLLAGHGPDQHADTGLPHGVPVAVGAGNGW
ncbi:hypothetical protein ACFF2X_21710 [Cryptosporangium minutisporangium]|uniref:Uncharacterized protein n=1 Tax=Cryptosporangium minutisporangium TaxID=113569 RepID=A0ABP6T1Z5_9ACTN